MSGEERSDKLLALVERIAVALERSAPIRQSELPIKDIPLCPSCNTSMLLRKSRKDGEQFWGCRNYPNCNSTRSLDGTPTIKKPRPVEQEELAPDGYKY